LQYNHPQLFRGIRDDGWRGARLHLTGRKGRTGKISDIFKIARANDGFTLIEILIVIAIIGVLAAIAIPQLSIYRTRAYNKAAVSDLKNAAIAQEAYHVDNKQYCNSLTTLSNPPYNLYLSGGVNFTIVSADVAAYSMEAYHPSGDVTYTASGPGGTIVP
jgi:type IV pilus assembly protein PilA